MKMHGRGFSWSNVALAVLVPLWLLLIVPDAFAQRSRGGSSGSGGGGGASSGGRSSGGGSAGGAAVPRGSSGGSTPSGPSAGSGGSREGAQREGRAVPRTAPPPSSGRGWNRPYRAILPWGFGGAGIYGRYYGHYYDPWFDPWYGGYGYAYPSYPLSGYGGAEGSLHLKVSPDDAEVYVDGYYAGVVDDFNGVFQRLHVAIGPHRIEIRALGYETLTFDVQVEPDQKITCRGELRRIR